MILVTGAARLLPGTREQALAAVRHMRDLTTREQGCEEYSFWVAIDDPDSFFLFEQWVDQESLDAHLAKPHTRDFGAAISALVDGPLAVTRYEIAHAGPPR